MMKIINHNPEDELTHLLKASKQDFQFDEQSIKAQLLSHLPTQEDLHALQHGFFTFRTLKIAGVVAVVLVFVSGTVVFASTATPGDRLFGLNKWGENIIFNLPLSVEQKAQLRTYIVSRRLDAIKELEAVTVADEKIYNRKLETVKHSDISLKAAIETVAANKKKLSDAGQTESAQRMEEVLVRLNNLAQEHEDRIQAMEASFPEGKMKESIRKNLMEIKTTHKKARVELQLEPVN
jgi:hypothetical protein